MVCAMLTAIFLMSSILTSYNSKCSTNNCRLNGWTFCPLNTETMSNILKIPGFHCLELLQPAAGLL